ncbi:MAG: glycosyltransferase family 4 protein [Deltaproteobacteria bacterium]|nr:glycosyltransferase family 4 protein [Deltaproteobacteria bacterium]
MNILEIETFGRGGLIHYAYNLSCALAERGHQVTLVTTAAYELEDQLPSAHTKAQGEASVEAKVQIVKAIGRTSNRLGARGPALLRNLTRKAEAIFDACQVAARARALRPDVVHFHCTNPISLLYILLLRLLRVPLVVTAHVVTPHERIRCQSTIYRWVHRLSPRIIAHSDFDRNRLLQEFSVDPERVSVIPHGEYGFFEQQGETGQEDLDSLVGSTAARHTLGLEPHHQVALFFGYIREYKGLDLLFEAWSAVLEARPEARLVVAGDPVQLAAARRSELEDWATRLGVHHHFDYIPFSQVARYFQAADVLVMPYRHISQSGVLYLALSLGVPVLATRVGALPEVLEDGESALLVEPESPAALAQALIRLLGDSELQERLAQGGLRVAEAHSWPAIAARTEGAFRELASSDRGVLEDQS